MFRHLARMLIGCLLLPVAGRALGPHEMLLLVNADSPRSIELANHYAHLRHIPEANIVALRLPPAARSPESFISREDFTRYIWDPVGRAIKDRRIDDHILAWTYSSDFPVLIGGDPEVSLTGLTLVRNELPDAEAIRRGTYASRLFAGPGPDLQRRGTSGSFEQYAIQLGARMPMPAIVLAHTGARGESTAQARRRMEQGVNLDGTRLAGQVLFLTSDDVRTTCRSWQFEDAVQELKSLGQQARIMPLTEATASGSAWGIMAGSATVDTAILPRLVPGSLAEHLTSFAALFYGHAYQTKMSAWLQAGAAGTLGTVTEPMSIWAKFPHARMFVHYARGCTLLEAMAQAVACPLQILAVGDPLLAPWARPPGATLIRLHEGTTGLTRVLEFAASSWSGPIRGGGTYYMLDGRTVLAAGEPPILRLKAADLDDGWHELRAVIYGPGAVRHQSMDRQWFSTAHRGRTLEVGGLSSNDVLELGAPRLLSVQASPPPRALALLHWGETIGEQAWSATNPVYRLEPDLLGVGPSRVQLVARYDDGLVRGKPVPVVVQRPDPERQAFGDRPQAHWQPLRLDTKVLKGGVTDRPDGGLEIVADQVWVLARSEVNPGEALEMAGRLLLPDGHRAEAGQRMMLAFAVKDRENFSAAMWRGEVGGWSLGRMVEGVWKPDQEIGATLEAGQPCVVRVIRAPSGGVSLEVNGEPMGTSSSLELRGPYGVGGGTSAVTVNSVGVWTLPSVGAIDRTSHP